MDSTTGKKKWYMLISNPTKSNHLGTLLRCAAAFDVHQVLLVGFDKFNSQGSFGSHSFLDMVAFHSWDSVVEYLKNGGENGVDGELAEDEQEKMEHTMSIPIQKNKVTVKNGIKIIGILGAYGGGEELYSPEGMLVYENSDTGYVSLIPPNYKEGISGHGKSHNNPKKWNNIEYKQSTNSVIPCRSLSVHLRQFASEVCFLVSKDKRGFPIPQARLCDGFVHVPHLSLEDADDWLQSLQSHAWHRPSKTAISTATLLDTASTFSIVLHHFTAWAKYEERTFSQNHKFLKDHRLDRGRSGHGMVRYYEGNQGTTDDEKEDNKKISSQGDAEHALVNLFGVMCENSCNTDY
mmetsp:Transcript_3356/g.7163  ORF Transcript_3356/g.7163 Transcript_3356/m.7163 type:complete len:349 (-) Transcript_3356:35-1081(-)